MQGMRNFKAAYKQNERMEEQKEKKCKKKNAGMKESDMDYNHFYCFSLCTLRTEFRSFT